MRDIYLYMKPKIRKSLSCILVGGAYKFFYPDGDDPLKNKIVIRPMKHIIDKTVQSYFMLDNYAIKGLYIDDQEVVCYEIPFCKHCGSLKVIRKDFNYRTIFDHVGNKLRLKLKRYECKKCGKKSQVELFGLYEAYSRFSNKIYESMAKSLRNGHKTIRQHAKDIRLYFNTSISHETIRKTTIIHDIDLYKRFDVETSGYVSYDAQWLPMMKDYVYRLILFDVVKNLPLAEAMVEKEDSDTIYEFIDKSIPEHLRKGITTDSKNDYDDVMERLDFTYHQHCIFHLLQRINELINDETRKYKREYKAALKIKFPEYSDKKLRKLTNEAGKKYRETFQPYHDEIKNIFNQETHEKAIECVEALRGKMETYPKFLSEYLIKNFFPVYKRYLVFLKKGTNGHLEKTNNKCENYIGKILDKYHKSKFKTLKGAFDYICHRVEGWIEKHILDYEKKPKFQSPYPKYDFEQ